MKLGLFTGCIQGSVAGHGTRVHSAMAPDHHARDRNCVLSIGHEDAEPVASMFAVSDRVSRVETVDEVACEGYADFLFRGRRVFSTR